MQPSAKSRLTSALARHGTAVLVTVAEVHGSAPREAGAWALATPEGFHGSIGGGALEFEALARAQALLHTRPEEEHMTLSLGPDLGQCCGGRVTLKLEVFDRSALARLPEDHAADTRRPLLLYGAGHVGRALALALAPLPFRVSWVDARAGQFPAALPENVTAFASLAPASAEPESFVLVMTHSHALDLAITADALANAHLPFVGLIGSATKRARFAARLRQAGLPEARIAAFACPIGVPGIRTKHPAAIAAATVAQLLERDELLRTAQTPLAVPQSRFKVTA